MLVRWVDNKYNPLTLVLISSIPWYRKDCTTKVIIAVAVVVVIAAAFVQNSPGKYSTIIYHCWGGGDPKGRVRAAASMQNDPGWYWGLRIELQWITHRAGFSFSKVLSIWMSQRASLTLVRKHIYPPLWMTLANLISLERRGSTWLRLETLDKRIQTGFNGNCFSRQMILVLQFW